MIVDDAANYRNFGHFREVIASGNRFDTSGLNEGRVTVRTPDDRVLGYTWQANDRRPRVERDGEHYDWDTNFHVFRPMDDHAPVSLDWDGGTLRVEAGGAVFEQTVAEDGTVTFSAE